MKNCKTIVNIISTYDDKALPKYILKHLNDCSHCNRVYTQMQLVYNQKDVYVQKDSDEIFLAKITDRLNKPKNFIIRMNVMKIAASLLIGVTLGFNLGNHITQLLDESNDQNKIEDCLRYDCYLDNISNHFFVNNDCTSNYN